MKKGILAVILLMALCITGCGKKAEPPMITEGPDYFEGDTIGLYAIDSGKQEIIQINVEHKDKPTLDSIVSLVIQNLDESVEVRKSEINKKKAIITFSEKTAPVKGCTEKIEGLILECFANSILDNLEECRAVVFRSGKGAYRGAYLSFDLNEVYATK